MSTITLLAYAKLNLTLEALYRRPDGYHELDTIMAAVSLWDTVGLTATREVGVRFSGPDYHIDPENNTLIKAIHAYQALAGDHTMGAIAEVTKRIPLEAGLGGGSADAAAALLGMQLLYGALDEGALYQAARMVGADVPFCLHGGLCRARGVGEQLTPLAAPPEGLWFLILKSGAGISTKSLFAGLAAFTGGERTQAAMAALRLGDQSALGKALFNGLAAPAAVACPAAGIPLLKERLLKCGALGAAMTGSGSAVFGLFPTREAAHMAEQQFFDLPFHTVAGTAVIFGAENRIG